MFFTNYNIIFMFSEQTMWLKLSQSLSVLSFNWVRYTLYQSTNYMCPMIKLDEAKHF